MSPSQRLSRDEQRARTRAELLDAARTVFARQGFHAASVDDVAEAAGYTKGAVYSNFESKEALFLALFEASAEDAVATVDAIMAGSDSPEDRIRALGEQRGSFAFFSPEWHLLETEYSLYVARNEHLRDRLADRQASLRGEIAKRIEQHLADTGATTSYDPEDLARLIGAAGDGLNMQQLAEGERAPDMGQLFSLLLELLLRGAADGNG